MIITILIAVTVTLWCLFSFALYGYHYILEVILDLPIVGDSPCSAHSALKVIIQKIIREANNLPKLNEEGTTNALDQTDRTYEDLLSTAILNKIISKSQKNFGTSCSSRANSVCSHKSSSSRRRLNKEYFFGDETLDSKWRNLETDTGSVSSIEEWVHSDSSIGSTKYVDRVSLTIKQRIEEVSSSESGDELDPEVNEDVDYFSTSSVLLNDEPNWFLQRRQFRGSASSPVPVPMLVPDPTVETKVLIGDKEIDDTSDLSDVPSDFEEENDKVSLLGVENHLIESKTLIGGKNLLADLSFIHQSDDEVSADSGVKECSKYLDEMDSEVFSTSTKIKHGNDFTIDESISSEGSHTERDTEYTEKYGTLPRTITMPFENTRLKENGNRDNLEQNQRDITKTKDPEEGSDGENELEFKGIYSQREKEKWRHAVELENNPYSKENIERRIKSRNSVNSLFGSDYYIRQACLPSGAKRTEAEKLSPSKQIEANGGETQELQGDQLSLQEGYIFTANPNIINEITDTVDIVPVRSPEGTTDPEINFSSEITSDSDISLVNCYDVRESVIYKTLSAENEEIQTAEKFFDFESLDANLISEEFKDEELRKPVAKPRTKLSSVPSTEVLETDIMKAKTKEIYEDNFDAKPFIINKRSDNTLIKRIYLDPSVRSFALNSRNKLPISEKQVFPGVAPQKNRLPGKTKITTEDTVKQTHTSTQENNLKFIIQEKPILSVHVVETNDEEKRLKDIDISSNKKLNGLNDIDKIYCGSSREINELKDQKLVANRLKELSKSSTNLAKISKAFSNGIERHRKLSMDSMSDESCDFISGFMNGSRSTSVKDLRRKFEMFDAKAKGEKPILYSLTGRSISKQLKNKLRNLTVQSAPQLNQVCSLSTTDLEVEENTR